MSMTAISAARNARFQVLIASDVAMLILNVQQHAVARPPRVRLVRYCVIVRTKIIYLVKASGA